MPFTLPVPAVSAEPDQTANDATKSEVTEIDPAKLHVHKLGEVDEAAPAAEREL